jgi:MFS family permease
MKENNPPTRIKDDTSSSPRDFSETVCRHNIRHGVLHGAFFHMATAFADPYAVIPLFLAGFTESRALIGLVVSLVGAMSVIPQISLARQIRQKPSLARPLMLFGIWTRCVVWGLIAVGALLLPMGSIYILIVFIFFVSVYSFGGGVAVIPFRKVISGTIPPERRSTFFGWRLFGGGILAIIAGGVVHYVLSSKVLAWPRNYGILFACSFAALAAAYTAMSRLRFPADTHTSQRGELPSLWKELNYVRRAYPVLKRLILVRLLSGGLPLILPFLTLYATHEVGLSLSWVGIFIASQKAGFILSNFLWGPLGNRIGTRAVILSGLALASLSCGTILISSAALSIALAFALAGSGMSALLVGFGGYVLELGTPEIRPLLFALEGTLLFPLYFMPVLGGWLADVYGYHSVVWIGGILLIGSLLCTLTLCEPRDGSPACGPSEWDTKN